MKSKLNVLYAYAAVVLLGTAACSEEDDPTPGETLEANTVEDLLADGENTGGHYTFYNLSEGSMIPVEDSASTEWDIAFRRTSVIINGGSSGSGQGAAQVVDGTLDDITEAPADGYEAEVPGGWYSYTGQQEKDSPTPSHAILTVPGKVIVLKTADGNHAKLEVISYYEGNPDTTTDEFYSLMTRPNSGYYTFRYVVQTNGSRAF